MQQPQSDDEVIEMMNASLLPGQTMVMSCRTCGALVYIRTGNVPASGDPLTHNEYHRQRGEL